MKNQTKRRTKAVALLLALWLLVSTMGTAALSAQEEELMGKTAGYLLQTVPEPGPGASGSDWAVLALARSGAMLPEGYLDGYYTRLERYVQEKEGVLTRNTYTEYSRTILVLAALGKDPAAVGGYSLLEKLGDYQAVLRQGISGPIYALLALDAGGYEIPVCAGAEVQASRQMYVDYLLSKQLEDGGFSLSGGADPDFTAMAVQALSAYRGQQAVQGAIDRALACLSRMQKDSGGFASWGTENVESTVQVILALCALGIDSSDSRFTKNGHTMREAMMSYAVPGGGFSHTPQGKSNLMATEQVMLALSALKRQEGGECGVYDMSDISAKTEEPERGWKEIWVNFSRQGELALTGEGRPVAQLSLLTQAATVDELLRELHRQYCPVGEAGYVTWESDWGVSMAELWGDTTGVGGFYVNGEMPVTTVAETALQDGDVVDLIAYREDWSDIYAAFTRRQIHTSVGVRVTLQLEQDGYDENYAVVKSPLAGAELLILGSSGPVETGAITGKDGTAQLTFTTAGTYLITARAQQAITVPVCTVRVWEQPLPAFTDLEDHWSRAAAEYTAGMGYFLGTSPTTFSPDEALTREQMATVLWRRAGCPEAQSAVSYRDADPQAYYAEALSWAAEQNLMNGYGDGTFGVGDALTREQMAVVFYRCAAKEGKVTEGAAALKSRDAGSISPWARDAMAWAVADGLIQGMDGRWNPGGSASRAQAATVWQRYDRR